MAQFLLFDALPRQIQSAIVAYANVADLSPATVIEVAVFCFLDLGTEPVLEPQGAIEESSILSELPVGMQVAIAQYALENQVPPEFVLELSIAHFLDPDSITFDDCQVGVRRDRVNLLKLRHQETPTA